MAKEWVLAEEGSFNDPEARITTDNANADMVVQALANDLIVEDTNGNTTLIWDASESEYRFVDTVDVRSDIESDTQTIWDDSESEIVADALGLVADGGLKTSSGQLAVEPADFAGTGLGDDGSDNLEVNEEPFAYDPGITEWEDGLSDEEIGRIALQTGETLRVERIEFRQKGGGSSASASIDVRDVTAGSTIGSQDLGGTTKDPGASGTANTVIIRVNNATGGPIDAAPRVTGWIEGA